LDDLFSYAARKQPPREPYPVGVPVAVCDLFESLSLRVHENGHKRYSADAILHRIRWHYHIERGDTAFKANNNWTAPLARWFLANHPEAPGFFETRERISQDEVEA
jgi:hypothetical protein